MEPWQTQRVFTDRDAANQLVKHLRVQQRTQRARSQLYGPEREYRVKVLADGQYAYQMRLKPFKSQRAA